MKTLIAIKKAAIITIIALCFSNIIAASTPKTDVSEMDSVQVSLLTCSPHNEVYSLYGHTAIRYQDLRQGVDVVINYGLFSFKKSFFILRFIFGLTDYEMGIVPFDVFYDEYRSQGCSVTQQVLAISGKAKQEIANALEQNYLPENRTYRYNYFYDNCTTRARDILISQTERTDGKVTYIRKGNGPSFREMIHQYNKDYPWARFGNDILLGYQADLPTTVSEQQFLPANLMQDFATAKLNGHKLIKETSVVVPAGSMEYGERFPLTPTVCGIILAALTLLVTIIEIRTCKLYWGVDAFFMLTSGICGIILFAMIFSQHPTVRINFQIFLLNPLPLFFIYNVISHTRKHLKTRWFSIQAVLILLFFIGGIFQQYAEGMYFVALSLLLRCISHWKADYKRVK